ncbi:MAG: DHHA1 domain-containing protein, partial [Alphaproteobacteria bacterium]
QGVVGIVASRLVERFRRPAVVAAIEDGIAIGSGRSVSGVALGPAIIDLREEGLLISGGGHNMAAGFRVAEKGFKRFVEVLSSKLSENIDKAAEEVSIRIDAVIGPKGAYAAANALEKLSPFGMGNPEPRFAVAGVRLKDLRVIKNSHLAIRLEGPDGFSISAMSFRSIGSPLGDFLQSRPAVIHAVGRIEINTWRGRDEARLVLEDAALAN